MSRPTVVMHASLSLDGRIDGFPIDVGLHYEIASRLRPDVHLTGSNTILEAFSASSDVASAEPMSGAGSGPLLVVPDSRGRITSWPAIRTSPFWRGAVALCASSTPGTYIRQLATFGVDFLLAGSQRVDLSLALSGLAQRYGARHVLLDGGPTLNGLMLELGLVDEISLLVHPSLAGELDSRPAVRLRRPVTDLRLTSVEPIGQRVWLRYALAAR